MPLTDKGESIKAAMQKQYGKDKGESVFYAAANKGTIKGVHEQAQDMGRKACLRRFTRHLRKQAR